MGIKNREQANMDKYYSNDNNSLVVVYDDYEELVLICNYKKDKFKTLCFTDNFFSYYELLNAILKVSGKKNTREFIESELLEGIYDEDNSSYEEAIEFMEDKEIKSKLF